jgi:hypothetical protein
MNTQIPVQCLSGGMACKLLPCPACPTILTVTATSGVTPGSRPRPSARASTTSFSLRLRCINWGCHGYRSNFPRSMPTRASHSIFRYLRSSIDLFLARQCAASFRRASGDTIQTMYYFNHLLFRQIRMNAAYPEHNLTI